jgi:hypothetical protein
MSALAGSVIVGVLWWSKHQAEADSHPVQEAAALIAQHVPSEPNAAASAAEFATKPGESLSAMARTALDSIQPPKFKVDAQGRLVHDPAARGDIELFVALYKHDEAMSRLKDATKDMPAQAQRDVMDLYQQYSQYAQAVTRSFPAAEQENPTLDMARAQLVKLKELRGQYFGNNASPMFQDEEAMTEKILNYADEYKRQHPNATLEEMTGYGQEKLGRELEAQNKAGAGEQSR